MIIDIGLNLAHGQFRKDLKAVLDRAVKAHVTTLVATGTDLKASRATIALIRRLQTERVGARLVCTVGVHPHNASSTSPDLVASLRSTIEANRDVAVAVGECGLDFNRDFSPRDVQIDVFRSQVELACELSLPLFCHERDAHDDFVRVLLPFLETGRLRPDRVVVHCFTGSEAALKTYVGFGFYIGLTGFIAMAGRGAHLRPLLRSIPSKQLLVETDAPFMHPSQKRVRCEPSDIHAVLETIAEAVGVTPEVVAATTTANAERFFQLAPAAPVAAPDAASVAIDGSLFEGGGQILRLAAPLAVLCNVPLTVHSIRHNRPKPGLARQHLAGLELLRAISNASFEGLALLSTSVSLRPRASPVQATSFTKDLQGAGSVSLVLQGVLPLLLLSRASTPTTLTLIGGTHVPFSPPMDFWSSGLDRPLATMGISYEVALKACGFMPLGRGHVIVSIAPVSTIQPLQLTTKSRAITRVQSHVVVYAAGASTAIVAACNHQLNDALTAALGSIPALESRGTVQAFKAKGGPKIALHVTIETTHGNVFTGSCIAATSVASAIDDVIAELRRGWDSDACVDEHIADNLLVYMALATGASALRVPSTTSSQHIEAALHVIQAMTGVPFTITPDGNSRIVACPGRQPSIDPRPIRTRT
ncbi:hypothetical protein SPRG_15152 [Saprolegnia parasitica CBS 223.65]|uniref:RNA 3'-terminal phosphate cyclase domain-containing protein n=1 Tax=Saprolegnia parasitica (strain CBS 223.65) TaxID=695850 RepID=A0A067BZ26_SAPPC|nr:hypothetical protein SPRG_15152 [Saprolegnia parasitica CBS 223.65]KDO19571.1 hypothetical protein SPRG_15152 [Saprolegnia parasitica CBS 223.65]|eukprot:XP_012209719.1 hypothetical protein SPRG_15152 [Saprolegnia parasitica CBS 223.65]